MRAEKPEQIGSPDPGGHAFDHDQSDAAIVSQQHNRGHGNPAFFFSVVQTPSPDYFLFRIAQKWKRYLVLPSYPFRLLRGIHAQPRNVKAEAAEVIA